MEIPGTYLEWRGAILVALLIVIYQNQFHVPSAQNDSTSYLIIGVSGGLQHGFPEHDKLHYTDPKSNKVVKAIYLGRALVRGYRGFLDVMSATHRQYHDAPARINSNVFATGCNEHANEYWVYAVDTRQAMGILNNEPRYLSITPDTGLVDLSEASGKYTTDLVKAFMRNEIRKQNKSIEDVVAIPLVTAVWFDETSHVPSPIVDTLADGTEITNYPQSLAKWAGMKDALPGQLPEVESVCDADENTCLEDRKGGSGDFIETAGYHAKSGVDKEYWDEIRKKIKEAEASRPTEEEAQKFHPAMWSCRKKARFGVSVEMARVNYAFTAKNLKVALSEAGYEMISEY